MAVGTFGRDGPGMRHRLIARAVAVNLPYLWQSMQFMFAPEGPCTSSSVKQPAIDPAWHERHVYVMSALSVRSTKLCPLVSPASGSMASLALRTWHSPHVAWQSMQAPSYPS